MKVSVVVPVYGVEKYLDECVESILAQTFSDFEVILVDDGSPDNCPAMCDAWAQKDARIRVIHKENGGLSSARNAGVAAAAGEYIAFVDSDDWVEPEFLAVLYGGAATYGADIVQCSMCQVTEQGKADIVCLKETVVYEKEFIRNVLMEDMTEQKPHALIGSRCNKLYRASVAKTAVTMCPESQSTGEDYLMTFAAVTLSTKIAALATPPLYNYRYNLASLSNVYTPRKRMQERSFWQAVYDIAQSAGCIHLPNVEKKIQSSHVNTIFECSVSNWRHAAKKEEIRILLSQITDRKLLLTVPQNETLAKRVCLALVYLGWIDLMLLLVNLRKKMMK